MRKIDWSNAPDGAEAAHPGNAGVYPAWYRRNAAGAVEHICPMAGITNWTYMGGRRDFPYGSEARPISSVIQWSGSGLPPAGTVCEVKGCMSHYLQWNKVTVFAVRGKTVFFDMEDGRWGQTDSHEFRPIRTPEQIAAEKEAERKQESVAAALRAIGGSSSKITSASNVSDVISALYDAGLIKSE